MPHQALRKPKGQPQARTIFLLIECPPGGSPVRVNGSDLTGPIPGSADSAKARGHPDSGQTHPCFSASLKIPFKLVLENPCSKIPARKSLRQCGLGVSVALLLLSQWTTYFHYPQLCLGKTANRHIEMLKKGVLVARCPTMPAGGSQGRRRLHCYDRAGWRGRAGSVRPGPVLHLVSGLLQQRGPVHWGVLHGLL